MSRRRLVAHWPMTVRANRATRRSQQQNGAQTFPLQTSHRGFLHRQLRSAGDPTGDCPPAQDLALITASPVLCIIVHVAYGRHLGCRLMSLNYISEGGSNYRTCEPPLPRGPSNLPCRRHGIKALKRLLFFAFGEGPLVQEMTGRE